MQITNNHLDFLEEAKCAFSKHPKLETYRNDDEDLIALRFGVDRDCIQIFELGLNVGFFVQQIKATKMSKRVIKQEENIND